MDPRIADANARYNGLPPRVLMENAGRGIADYIKASYDAGTICIVCGPGNNGGDGFVIARHLEGHFDVDVIVPFEPSSIKTPEAKENFELLEHCRVNVIRSYVPPDEWNYDLIVDAMLGTGIVGEVREPYLSYINKMNGAESAMLSVDIESGHGTDTKVNSDIVISLHESKQDDAMVLPIGIPDRLTKLCGPGNVKFLNRRPTTAHKGNGGSMAVIGGSEKYHGAPTYSSIAGSTICDLVYVICPKKVSGAIRCSSPDIIVEETSSERLDGSILDHPRIHEVDSILCGVGAGRSNSTLDAFREFYHDCKMPLIIDADGLHALKGHLDLLKGNMCITPHAKEFASLFGELPAGHAERKDVVESLALEYGCTILLKGKIDIISSDGQTWENRTGNEGMTTGGTGDVLAGCTAAFAAKNPLLESALASSFVVGLAGDMVYANDDLFYTASDVLGMLPDALSFCNRF